MSDNFSFWQTIHEGSDDGWDARNAALDSTLCTIHKLLHNKDFNYRLDILTVAELFGSIADEIFDFVDWETDDFEAKKLQKKYLDIVFIIQKAALEMFRKGEIDGWQDMDGDIENNGQILADNSLKILAGWDLIHTLNTTKLPKLTSSQTQNPQNNNSKNGDLTNKLQTQNSQNSTQNSNSNSQNPQAFWQRKLIQTETFWQTSLQISTNRTNFIDKLTNQNGISNENKTQNQTQSSKITKLNLGKIEQNNSEKSPEKSPKKLENSQETQSFEKINNSENSENLEKTETKALNFDIFEETFAIAAILRLWQENTIKISKNEYIQISTKLIQIKQIHFSLWSQWQMWFAVLKKQIPKTLNQSDKMDRMSMIQTWKLSIESLAQDWVKIGKMEFENLELENSENFDQNGKEIGKEIRKQNVENLDLELTQNTLETGQNGKLETENLEKLKIQNNQNGKEVTAKSSFEKVEQNNSQQNQSNPPNSKFTETIFAETMETKFWKSIKIPANKNENSSENSKNSFKNSSKNTLGKGEKTEKNNEIKGKIAITGRFGFTREEIVKLLELNGWKSEKVENADYILVGFAPSSKLEKADKLGIKMLNWAELVALLAT